MAVKVTAVSDPSLMFELSGTGITNNVGYANTIAQAVSHGYDKLSQAMVGVSDSFMNRLTASTQYYSDLDVLEDSVELVETNIETIFVTEYTIENYMDIPYEMQELVMHDPIIRAEYEDGEIEGYGYNYNGSVEYDDTVNELLYSGISDGDIAHDIVLGAEYYYTPREVDVIEKTRMNLMKAILEDGEDVTDIH